MLTSAKIIMAMTKKVKEILKANDMESIPIIAEGIEEPIVRPSIKIICEEFKAGRFNEAYISVAAMVRVYYFAKDRNNTVYENADMSEMLVKNLIGNVNIEDEYILEIDEVESEVADGVLIVSSRLSSVEELERTESGETMENLIYK